MDLDAVPIVRLELQRMRHAITHYLGVHGSELGEAIDQRVVKVIAEYDFDGIVSRIASEVITESINSYFQYGAGHDCIRKAVQDALNKTFQEEEGG